MHDWPETGGNLVKGWVIPLSWDFLVSTLTHPSKEFHIATVFRAPVNDVGDKFGSALTGLGFHRRGAPERRNGTKRLGLINHACKSVIWVLDAKDSLTHCVRASPASTSLS